MNREEAKALLPVIQAYIDGRQMQASYEDGPWEDIAEPSFNFHIAQYRPKPEPEWRAWKEAEIPKYIIIRWKADRIPDLLVNGCWMNGSKPSLDVLLVNYVRILEDGSEVPCGVEVDGE